MRRRMRGILLAAAAVLLVAGMWHVWQRSRVWPLNSGGGSASLGLVLLGAEQGVYVLAVSEQSPAEAAGLEPGDYILAVEGEAVADVGALDERLTGPEPLRLNIRRDGALLELTLPVR